jgi:hypothetical protein
MSNLFLSHAGEDTELAIRLQEAMLAKGHRIRIPAGSQVAGFWRGKFTAALVASDVLIVLLTEDGLASPNVLGEIGAARAINDIHGMLLLPVLVGDLTIPYFISDVQCFRLRATDPAGVYDLAAQLHKAIEDDVMTSPRIFVSHQHADESIAGALVKLLGHAFDIGPHDIRCTSVKPFVLGPGERTSEQLRREIARAELVIGILTPQTSHSNYVLCELGASWGRDVPTFPVLTRGATIADVPAPLNERHSISIESADNCLDLVDYVASKTTLQRKESQAGALAVHARALAEAARLPRSAGAADPTLVAGFASDTPTPGRDGRCRVRFGIIRCPSDTSQVVFCGNDERLLTGGAPLESELCQVVRTTPARGVLWAPEEEYWSVSGDCRFYALGIRADTYFAVSAGLCEALRNWYTFSGLDQLPKDVQKTVEYLEANNGANPEPRRWEGR